MKQYAEEYNTDVFVETGTYLGDMINAVENNFKSIYSVELSEELYKRAKELFKKNI